MLRSMRRPFKDAECSVTNERKRCVAKASSTAGEVGGGAASDSSGMPIVAGGAR